MADEMRVAIRSGTDIVTARQQGRELAATLDFSRGDLALVATAISEVARNIVSYAGEGEILLSIIEEDGRQGILIVASDRGPGIEDVDEAMRDGYSSGGSLGLGLPGSRRIMDDFQIRSKVGEGTTVTMKKFQR
jgi:serine/threonine-protein kinase RsbT